MGNIYEIRAEALKVSARTCQRADLDINQGLFRYPEQIQPQNTQLSDNDL